MGQTMTKAKEEKTSRKDPGFRPLGSRVLLRRMKAEDQLKGGIVLPDSAKQKEEKAEVVSVGPGKKDKNGQMSPMPVKVGDVVLIEKYSGQDVKIEDEEYVIVRDSDLIAIVD